MNSCPAMAVQRCRWLRRATSFDTPMSLRPNRCAQARQSGATCTVGARAAARVGMLDPYEIHNRGGRTVSTYRSSKNLSWDRRRATTLARWSIGSVLRSFGGINRSPSFRGAGRPLLVIMSYHIDSLIADKGAGSLGILGRKVADGSREIVSLRYFPSLAHGQRARSYSRDLPEFPLGRSLGRR